MSASRRSVRPKALSCRRQLSLCAVSLCAGSRVQAFYALTRQIKKKMEAQQASQVAAQVLAAADGAG